MATCEICACGWNGLWYSALFVVTGSLIPTGLLPQAIAVACCRTSLHCMQELACKRTDNIRQRGWLLQKMPWYAVRNRKRLGMSFPYIENTRSAYAATQYIAILFP